MPAHLFCRLLPVALGLYCCSLAACKGTSGSKKTGYAGVVDYTTPETNLSQEEYPFDEKGNYLPDVVSGKTKGRKNKSSGSLFSKNVADVAEAPPPEPTLAASAPANYEIPPESSPVQPETSSGSTARQPSPPPAKPSSASKSSAARPSTTASAKPKPTASKTKSTASKSKPAAKKPSTLSYTIKKGDTLSELADRYNTSVAAIKKASGLSSNLLRDGRTLRIPRK